MLEIENKAAVIVCAGVQGTGKTTFGLRLVANRPYAVVFIFDPEGEYEQRLGIPAARDLYELSLALCHGWVLFDPSEMFTGRNEEAFACFCEFAFEKSAAIPGRKLLIVDEAWKYTTPHRQPIELTSCVQAGRKRGLECLFNTQRPHKLNDSIRNECTELVCFRLGDDKPLEYAQSYGFNPEEVRALADLQLISRSQSGGEVRGAIKI